ncbi:unnamed protein product, partial [Amoebophrya sp. A120]|eukprot:GSA120T00010061001.1
MSNLLSARKSAVLSGGAAECDHQGGGARGWTQTGNGQHLDELKVSSTSKAATTTRTSSKLLNFEPGVGLKLTALLPKTFQMNLLSGRRENLNHGVDNKTCLSCTSTSEGRTSTSGAAPTASPVEGRSTTTMRTTTGTSNIVDTSTGGRGKVDRKLENQNTCSTTNSNYASSKETTSAMNVLSSRTSCTSSSRCSGGYDNSSAHPAAVPQQRLLLGKNIDLLSCSSSLLQWPARRSDKNSSSSSVPASCTTPEDLTSSSKETMIAPPAHEVVSAAAEAHDAQQAQEKRKDDQDVNEERR